MPTQQLVSGSGYAVFLICTFPGVYHLEVEEGRDVLYLASDFDFMHCDRDRNLRQRLPPAIVNTSKY